MYSCEFEMRGDETLAISPERNEKRMQGRVVFYWPSHVHKRNMIGYGDGPTQGNLKVLATTIDITFLH